MLILYSIGWELQIGFHNIAFLPPWIVFAFLNNRGSFLELGLPQVCKIVWSQKGHGSFKACTPEVFTCVP